MLLTRTTKNFFMVICQCLCACGCYSFIYLIFIFLLFFSLCCCGRLMVLKQLRESESQRVIEDFWRTKQCFNIFRSGWELSRRLVSTWQLLKWSMLLWSRINKWKFKKTTEICILSFFLVDVGMKRNWFMFLLSFCNILWQCLIVIEIWSWCFN